MFDIQDVIDKIETTDEGFKEALMEAEDYTTMKTVINERITELLTQYSASIKRNGQKNMMFRKISDIEEAILSVVKG